MCVSFVGVALLTPIVYPPARGRFFLFSRLWCLIRFYASTGFVRLSSFVSSLRMDFLFLGDWNI
jgi:hypothetical protein